MVIAEASGGYERKLMRMLMEHHIAVALINPRLARAFAQSEGIKAKTDPIDARMLLRFAKEKQPPPSRSIGAEREQLAALLDRRAQLSEQMTKEKNRLDKCPQSIRASIRKMLRLLERELARIEAQIDALVRSNQQMHAQFKLMQDVSGVGPNTAWSILAYLSEITSLKRNEQVALAGLAPYNRECGKYKGKRSIQGGRAKVRKTLYMAAQSAAQHNPHIKADADRLQQKKGKPYKYAMTAVMRKLNNTTHTPSIATQKTTLCASELKGWLNGVFGEHALLGALVPGRGRCSRVHS